MRKIEPILDNRMFKKTYNFFHIIHNLFIKEKIFFKRETYSQDKSDLEIKKFFNNKNDGFFVDVGCFHPTRMNNTYLLYKKGWRGINIDLSQFSIDLFNYLRPEDINITSAVSDKIGDTKVYFQKNFSVISTLKKKLAEKRFQGKINEKKITTNTLNNIINNTKFKNTPIDFLSIDAEGMDEIILKSLDFQIYKPKLICVEDSMYNRKYNETNLYKILKPHGYRHLWSSMVNHLFYIN
tara:strand:+ start:548 stop:1261 length:714 start_codon:yes stop_codon:yes gene_type:complete